MKLINSFLGYFRNAAPRINDPVTVAGRCKVCGKQTKPSKHPQFQYCRSCGCYSNFLPNDLYDENFWYAHVDSKIVEQDIAHWRRVTNRFVTLMGDQSYSQIVDLAGGLGLFSAALQEKFHSPALLVDRCSIPESVIQYDPSLPNQLIKTDVNAYLNRLSEGEFSNPLVVNSHFIEHLELSELVNFLRTLRTKFSGALVCLYFPSADQARGHEADFLHFNTNLPGEHRIVWSIRPFVELLDQLNIQTLHAEPFDLDALLICRL